MKKLAVVICSVLLLVVYLTLPLFAAGNQSSLAGDPELHFPVFDHVTVSQSIRQSTYSRHLSFGVDLSYFYNSSSNSSTYVRSITSDIGPGYDFSGASASPDSIDQLINCTFNANTGSFQVELPFSSLIKMSHIEEQNFVTRLTVIDDQDAVFVSLDDLEYGLLLSPIVTFTSGSGSSRAVHHLKVDYIRKYTLPDNGGISYLQTSVEFTGSSSTELLNAILKREQDDSDNNGLWYDIVSISDYWIELSTYVSDGGASPGMDDGILDGSVSFDVEVSDSNYTLNDYITQQPSGSRFGWTRYETIYNSDLNIDGVFGAVKDALSVDLFGTLSFMDIITLIAGIAIAIWLLKVFAGG